MRLFVSILTDIDGVVSEIDDLDGDDYIEDDGPILDDDGDYDFDEHGDQMVRGDVSKDVEFVKDCAKMIQKYHGNKAFFVCVTLAPHY